jgi:hypothetical protein
VGSSGARAHGSPTSARRALKGEWAALAIREFGHRAVMRALDTVGVGIHPIATLEKRRLNMIGNLV